MNKLLASVSIEDIHREAALARSVLGSSDVWKDVRSLISYIPFPRGEFDVAPLNRLALEEGKELLLPVTRGNTISLVPVPGIEGLDGSGFLVPSRFKHLLEPDPVLASVPLEALDEPILALIPARAFDSVGRRLGRGLGCYDRFLEGLYALRSPGFRLCTMGMALSVQLLEEIPVGPFDQSLDALYLGGSILRVSRDRTGGGPLWP